MALLSLDIDNKIPRHTDLVTRMRGGDKSSNRQYRRHNLTPDQVAFYNWIDEIQSLTGLDNVEFAMLFEEVLEDPVQSFKFYRNRNGVFPNDRVINKLKELYKLLVGPRIRQVIFVRVKGTTKFVALYWDIIRQEFRVSTKKIKIYTEQEIYELHTIKRKRNT